MHTLCSEGLTSPLLCPLTRRLVHLATSWRLNTHTSHIQCAEAVAPAGPGRVVLTCDERNLSVFSLDESVTLCKSPLLPFDVYGCVPATLRQHMLYHKRRKWRAPPYPS